MIPCFKKIGSGLKKWRDRAVVAREPHKLEVDSSNLSPATK